MPNQTMPNQTMPNQTMPNEYKISKVSDQEPKKYDGQYGTTYYIKVMLDGYAKPVEIGKKSPDALKTGDTVYGSITATEYQTDKFKGEQRPFEQKSFNKVEDPAKQDSIIRQSSMKASIDLVSNGKIELDELYTRAEEIVAWVKNKLLVLPESLKKGEPSLSEPDYDSALEEDIDLDGVNLDDIPF